MNIRRIATLSILALFVLGAQSATSASAAPVWNLEIHHNQTNFAPGETGEYWFDITNVGDTASSGPITLALKLPAGLTRDGVTDTNFGFPETKWNCPGSAGESSFTCTTNNSIPRHTVSRRLLLSVNVGNVEPGTRFASAKVYGGGATEAASSNEPTPIDPEAAGFGIFAPSFTPGFFGADSRTPVLEAGAHPDLLTVPFDFNSVDLSQEAIEAGEYYPNQKSESGST